MIRMIKDDDIMTIWWWYNWYISHTNITFETQPLSYNDFADRIHRVRESYPWIVLQEGGELCGYAYLSPFNPRDAYVWTADLSIYLNPDKRHMGYGTQLMQEICKLAKLDGYRNVISLITSENEASMKFHEKHGFETCGVLPACGFKNGKWLSVTYMMKTVNDTMDAMDVPENRNPYAEPRAGRVPIPE